MVANHELVAALVRLRIKEAIDLPALLSLEGYLEDTIEGSQDPDTRGVSASGLVDDAWRHVEDEWRRIRAFPAGDCSCPLCPPEGVFIDVDVHEAPDGRRPRSRPGTRGKRKHRR